MMKKLLSIILTVCMLFSLVVVPVAVNAEEGDATYTVTFDYLEAETTSAEYADGAEIDYPDLDANMNYDHVWSLDQNKYVPAPAKAEADITVYELKNAVISFENFYNESDSYDAQHDTNTLVSSQMAYTGTHSLKCTDNFVRTCEAAGTTTKPADWDTNYYKNYYYLDENGEAYKIPQSDTVPEFEPDKVYVSRNNATYMGLTSIRDLVVAKNDENVFTFKYKITFKYYATERNVEASTVRLRLTCYPNFNNSSSSSKGLVQFIDGQFAISEGATNGWQTATMYCEYTGTPTFFNGSSERKLALDFQFRPTTATATGKTECEVYIDDIQITENYENVPAVIYHEGDTEVTVTEGFTVGEEFNIDRLASNVPAGKYFVGWTDVNGNFVTKATVPDVDKTVKYAGVDLYAVYADYLTDGSVIKYDYDMDGEPAINGVGYLKNGIYNNKLVQGGQGSSTDYNDPRKYTKDGLELGRDRAGDARGWDISLDGASSGFVAPGEIVDGETLLAGRNEVAVGEKAEITNTRVAQHIIIRDKDGNVAVPKPNTKYVAVITLKRIGEASVSLELTADRKEAYYTNLAGAGTATSGKVAYTYATIDVPAEVSDEYTVATVEFTTGEYTDATNVLGVRVQSALMGERVSADVAGAESIVVDGSTYYPFKVVGDGRVVIKEIALTEVEEGNVTVTYMPYEKGVGYSAVIVDGVPGAANTNVPDTKAATQNWYDDAVNEIMDTSKFPSEDTTYYTISQLIKGAQTSTQKHIGDSIFEERVEKDGEYINALKYDPYTYDEYAAKFNKDIYSGSTIRTEEADKVERMDMAYTQYNASAFNIGTVEDAHTYKLTFSYMAKTMDKDLGFGLYTDQATNFATSSNYHNTVTTNSKSGVVNTISKVDADGTTWYDVTYYFTADPRSKNASQTETGLDYNLSENRKNNCHLYMFFSHSVTKSDLAGEDFDIYFTDIKLTDLGASLATAGASVLTEEAAAQAGQQAIRYYFDYETTDGSDIVIDGQTFTVVERGFLYRNGLLAYNAIEATGYNAGNKNILKRAKNDEFNTCWAYNEETDMMRFSTYVVGFKDTDLEKKLEVKGYIIFEDANGKQHTIHSATINRTVKGVKENNGATDSDIALGA